MCMCLILKLKMIMIFTGITNQPLLFAKQGKRRKINRVPRKQIFILYQNHKKTVIRFRNAFNFPSQ